MAESIIEIARRIGGYRTGSTKPEPYYELYETYLAPLREKPDLAMIELGVFDGDSLRVFAHYFPQARLLGIDLEDKRLDFSAEPAVRFAQADQTDALRLRQLAGEFAPGGLDVVIDDASHLGWFSKLTFDALFPHVKPGGLYVVEDWGTGYIGDWPDGGAFEPLRGLDGDPPRRLPSHDLGMVGFVKSLIDGVWSESIRDRLDGPAGPASPIAAMHVHPGMVVLRKAG